MISVGNRDDGRKGLSLRYGVEGGNMNLEAELEEGEAYFQNSNNNNNYNYNNHNHYKNDDYDEEDDDDNSTIDPDVALSYLDEKLQDVLGHFQKDFEGGVSAENLGAKFGGYGSFLPSYQRSPVCPHPKTPPKPHTNNASISPNALLIEGGRVSGSSTSQPTRHGPVSSSGAPMVGPSMNGKLKQDMHMSSVKAGDRLTSNGQSLNNFANACDPKSLKVRIKVGSDNLSTRKKAELYSGLGLDDSPSSSLEASPVNNDEFCHNSPHDDSPTSILEMMTSFPILGGLLLSPLPDDLLCLTEKDKKEDSSCGSVHKQSQESSFKVKKSNSKVDRDVLSAKKPKTEKYNTSIEPAFKEVPAVKSEPAFVPKEASLNPVSTHDVKKEGLVVNVNPDEKFVTFPTKSESDVSKSGVKPRMQKPDPKDEKDGIKLTTSSSGGKKKSKVSKSVENGYQSTEVSKVGVKNDSSIKNKNNNKLKIEDPKNNNGKVREMYKDFFGDELEDGDDMALDDKPLENKSKVNKVTEKGYTLQSSGLSKDGLNGKKDPKPSSSGFAVTGSVGHGPPTTGNGVPVPDAAPATVAAAVVNEDWVCCDKCEKWRLLPPGVNPGSLPEKWLCSMLDWLPGMNKCSISQEETTKAMTTQFLGPTAPAVNGFQPSAFQTGEMAVDPQRHQQPFGQQVGAKKKNGMKDVLNEPKLERPSLSSNSTKKNLQTSHTTRSLNQSPRVNELEFQDSGQSSSMIAEKHRFKHKAKKKSRENVVDEGNDALQVRIRNSRETSEDYSRDSKKVKTDGQRGKDKDRVSDHDGAIVKAVNGSVTDFPLKDQPRKYDDPKSFSKVSSINPKIENGKCEGAKKRKSSEFDDAQKEETSENGRRTGKKAKVPESREEEKGRLVESSRRNVASLAATSSSSKVSGSRKTKTENRESKGSPVESVSSSPLRILNPDKLTSSRRTYESADNSQDPNKDRRKDLDVTETVPSLEFESLPFAKGHNGERKKSGKGPSSSRSKDKHRSHKSDMEAANHKISEHINVNEEKSKRGRNRSQDKPSVNNPDKREKVSALKKESSEKPQNVSIESDGKRLSKKDVAVKGRPHSLPPSGKVQNDISRPPQPFSQKENAGNGLLVGNVETGDGSKETKPKKKDENQNGNQSVSVRHPTPNVHKGTPSPLRRESSSQASSAIKEAKALKHMADRLKNSGSNNESNSLYFQAALKFLFGSSILESNYAESGKHADLLQSTDLYSSTAKLCEYVAHEYEKSKEMAAAALAYKLAEVAYLKVVYSAHPSASKDRQELQTTLTGPTGESPSSSASDIDNLNNPLAVEKAAVAKSVNDHQIGGTHVIAARNKPNFLRILNFAQDVNFAMEAHRRSQVAFAASGSLQEIVKPALDFHFQNIEGLLQLVRVAMEVISR
ncbi:cysteine-tryptophan domain-containing zinc finger protein 3 [Rutidosis leptorrhynchoides]|uniref:cysteine-tryptophan domain-containing zinc finger protein 3 n=1 Tax=Rutidosis leptorrhynchoides TaxID=125765 RepID=UPI003A9A3734